MCKFFCTFVPEMRKCILYIVSVLFVLSFSSCEWLRKYRHGEVAATYGDAVLYTYEVEAITQHAKTSSDSAQLAAAYIAQWVNDVRAYEDARAALGTDKSIEQQVEAFRKQLYIYAYQQRLVDEQMPKHVEEDSVIAFYEQYQQHFILKESILQGMMLVIPNEAPQQADLKKWLHTWNTATNDTVAQLDALEQIEKYAYHSALGYELFTEQWHTITDIMYLPVNKLHKVDMEATLQNVEKQLRTKNLIEVQDTVNTCLICVHARHLKGEVMPLEYARREIERLILEKRQVEFLSMY